MKSLVLRANGSEQIGLGHIYRCLALSEVLREDFNVRFATCGGDAKVKSIINEFNLEQMDLAVNGDVSFAQGSSVVVVDGYWHTNAYIRDLKAMGCKVVEIDDIPKKEYVSDLIINHAAGVLYSDSVFLANAKLLCGPAFAMLRKEFLSGTTNPMYYNSPQVVTLSMGGADPQNLTLRLLRALSVTNNGNLKLVNVLIGSAYKHSQILQHQLETLTAFECRLHSDLAAKEIANLFAETSLLLCPASTTAYEACAVGVTTAVFLTAANQVNMHKGLISSGAVTDGGDLSALGDEELIERLNNLLNNYAMLKINQASHPPLIDKCSGKRLRKHIMELWN